jgi:hypothetical protein
MKKMLGLGYFPLLLKNKIEIGIRNYQPNHFIDGKYSRKCLMRLLIIIKWRYFLENWVRSIERNMSLLNISVGDFYRYITSFEKVRGPLRK